MKYLFMYLLLVPSLFAMEMADVDAMNSRLNDAAKRDAQTLMDSMNSGTLSVDSDGSIGGGSPSYGDGKVAMANVKASEVVISSDLEAEDLQKTAKPGSGSGDGRRQKYLTNYVSIFFEGSSFLNTADSLHYAADKAGISTSGGSEDGDMSTDEVGWGIAAFVKTAINGVNTFVTKIVSGLYVIVYGILFDIQFFLMMMCTPFLFWEKYENAFKGQVKTVIMMTFIPAFGSFALAMWTIFMRTLVNGGLGAILSGKAGIAAGVMMFAGGQSISVGILLAFVLTNVIGTVMIIKEAKGWAEKMLSGASIAGDILKTGATAVIGGAFAPFAGTLSTLSTVSTAAAGGGVGATASKVASTVGSTASTASAGSSVASTAEKLAANSVPNPAPTAKDVTLAGAAIEKVKNSQHVIEKGLGTKMPSVSQFKDLTPAQQYEKKREALLKKGIAPENVNEVMEKAEALEQAGFLGRAKHECSHIKETLHKKTSSLRKLGGGIAKVSSGTVRRLESPAEAIVRQVTSGVTISCAIADGKNLTDMARNTASSALGAGIALRHEGLSQPAPTPQKQEVKREFKAILGDHFYTKHGVGHYGGKTETGHKFTVGEKNFEIPHDQIHLLKKIERESLGAAKQA